LRVLFSRRRGTYSWASDGMHWIAIEIEEDRQLIGTRGCFLFGTFVEYEC
jgi:hypothetical protein